MILIIITHSTGFTVKIKVIAAILIKLLLDLNWNHVDPCGNYILYLTAIQNS